MVYVRIELWPGGDKARAEILGEAYIACVKAATDGTRSYFARLSYFGGFLGDEMRRSWKQGFVHGHAPTTRGPFDLVYRTLGALLHDRGDPFKDPAEMIEGVSMDEITTAMGDD